MTLFHIPDDVRETVRAHRTMAEIIRELGEQHQRHVERIDALLANSTIHNTSGGQDV